MILEGSFVGAAMASWATCTLLEICASLLGISMESTTEMGFPAWGFSVVTAGLANFSTGSTTSACVVDLTLLAKKNMPQTTARTTKGMGRRLLFDLLVLRFDVVITGIYASKKKGASRKERPPIVQSYSVLHNV